MLLLLFNVVGVAVGVGRAVTALRWVMVPAVVQTRRRENSSGQITRLAVDYLSCVLRFCSLQAARETTQQTSAPSASASLHMSNFLKLKHVHVNKDRIKASFDITVKKLINAGEYNGKPITFSWKRGKRPANHGSLKEVVVDHGEAVWDEKIVVQVTLFKDIGVDKFDEKSLALQISQVKFYF